MSGRPTKLQQEKIRNTIIESYISGLSPTQIIQKTRFNKDTVYQYLKKLDEQSEFMRSWNENTIKERQEEIMVIDKILKSLARL